MVFFSFSAGVIKNTEPLDYDKSHNHILSVVAYDCGMKRSPPVLVTIKVSRVCSLGWKGKNIWKYISVLRFSFKASLGNR